MTGIMYFLLFMSFGGLIIGNLIENTIIVGSSTILLWNVFFVKSFKRWRKSILVVLFLGCFFLFLLGTPFAELFGFSDPLLNVNEKIFMLNILYLALASLWVGTVFPMKLILTSKNVIKTDNFSRNKSLENFSLYLFCIGFPFYIYKIIHRILFVNESGYLAYYTSYSGTGTVVDYGSIICTFGYFLFLACCPAKKKAMMVLIPYLIVNILSVLSGQRTGMVVGLVFFLYYLILRHNQDEKEVWVKRKYILFAAALMPLLFVFLGYWAFARTDTIDLNMDVMDYFNFFISANGGSSTIIAYTDTLRYTLENLGYHSYTFGYLIRLINGITYDQNSIDMAMSGTSLGASVTYLSDARIFLLGGGLGTCYIAELWIDFGVVGVFIYNFILGFFLDKMSCLKFTNPIGIMFAFSIVCKLFVLPRNEALSMLPYFNSVVFWSLVIIAVAVKYQNKLITK